MNIISPIVAAGIEEPSDAELFAFTRGPRQADVILVGEAWGAEEAAAQVPFVGSSGKELTRMLADAGLTDARLLYTNVIADRPPGNDFTTYVLPSEKKKVEPNFYGARLQPQLLAGLHRLDALIHRVRPKLLIACGNWPLFALTPHAELKTTKGFKLPTGIAKWRGSQTFSRDIHGTSYPVLPLIHPAAILREWGWRAPTVQDLRRGARFLRGELSWAPPTQWRVHRPKWDDVRTFLTRIQASLAAGPVEISVDLETFKRRWISVVGLADKHQDLVVPLLYKAKDGSYQSYWPLGQEQEFFLKLKEILEHPNVRIIGQNFIYDTEWLWRYYSIKALVSFDTMVAHHLLFPGTPKRLDYLASLYCNSYCYWKDEAQDWDDLPDDADRMWLYNAKDIRSTFEIAQVLKQTLIQQKMEHLYAERMEQWLLSREMSLRGSNFNLSLQREMRSILVSEAMEIETQLLSMVPEYAQFASSGKPWFASPTATARLFYDILKLEPVKHKKTKRPTTDDAALQELSDRPGLQWLGPLFEALRHLRSINVFNKNFLAARMRADGRMCSTFNIAHPETFRWSSNRNGFGEGLNGQNIPKGDKGWSEAELEEMETGDNFFASGDPDV